MLLQGKVFEATIAGEKDTCMNSGKQNSQVQKGEDENGRRRKPGKSFLLTSVLHGAGLRGKDSKL